MGTAYRWWEETSKKKKLIDTSIHKGKVIHLVKQYHKHLVIWYGTTNVRITDIPEETRDAFFDTLDYMQAFAVFNEASVNGDIAEARFLLKRIIGWE